jgi:hypothetical protein
MPLDSGNYILLSEDGEAKQVSICLKNARLDLQSLVSDFSKLATSSAFLGQAGVCATTGNLPVFLFRAQQKDDSALLFYFMLPTRLGINANWALELQKRNKEEPPTPVLVPRFSAGNVAGAIKMTHVVSLPRLLDVGAGKSTEVVPIFGALFHQKKNMFVDSLTLDNPRIIFYFFLFDTKNNNCYLPCLPNIHTDGHICLGSSFEGLPKEMKQHNSPVSILDVGFSCFNKSAWNADLLTFSKEETDSVFALDAVHKLPFNKDAIWPNRCSRQAIGLSWLKGFFIPNNIVRGDS